MAHSDVAAEGVAASRCAGTGTQSTHAHTPTHPRARARTRAHASACRERTTTPAKPGSSRRRGWHGRGRGRPLLRGCARQNERRPGREGRLHRQGCRAGQRDADESMNVDHLAEGPEDNAAERAHPPGRQEGDPAEELSELGGWPPRRQGAGHRPAPDQQQQVHRPSSGRQGPQAKRGDQAQHHREPEQLVPDLPQHEREEAGEEESGPPPGAGPGAGPCGVGGERGDEEAEQQAP
mmetsp:Transcript_66324/g.197327  ORF Transcript_66324/g.197327 Transcript_66324/m.197327 type:complete len:236 (-) Transcript_66324:482-1189(-)